MLLMKTGIKHLVIFCIVMVISVNVVGAMIDRKNFTIITAAKSKKKTTYESRGSTALSTLYEMIRKSDEKAALEVFDDIEDAQAPAYALTQKDEQGLTVLHLAAAHGMSEIVNRICPHLMKSTELPSPINRGNKKTPIQYAIEALKKVYNGNKTDTTDQDIDRYLSIIETLLGYGAVLYNGENKDAGPGLLKQMQVKTKEGGFYYRKEILFSIALL